MKRNIILIGTMGSGKSHLGRNLAEAKGWQFVDTDRLLERRYNLPIAEIYEKLGEKMFRSAEREILKKVCMYHECIISVGGMYGRYDIYSGMRILSVFGQPSTA